MRLFEDIFIEIKAFLKFQSILGFLKLFAEAFSKNVRHFELF
jgi:hypothetical protein